MMQILLSDIIFLQNRLTKEEVHINAAVHSRLIGSKGRNIRKIMDEYKVDIKFPRKTDPDPNIVTIKGAEENITQAKDHLLNLEEEYVCILHFIFLNIILIIVDIN